MRDPDAPGERCARWVLVLSVQCVGAESTCPARWVSVLLAYSMCGAVFWPLRVWSPCCCPCWCLSGDGLSPNSEVVQCVTLAPRESVVPGGCWFVLHGQCVVVYLGHSGFGLIVAVNEGSGGPQGRLERALCQVGVSSSPGRCVEVHRVGGTQPQQRGGTVRDPGSPGEHCARRVLVLSVQCVGVYMPS